MSKTLKEKDYFDPWIKTEKPRKRCVDCGAVLSLRNESERCWTCGEYEQWRNPNAKAPWEGKARVDRPTLVDLTLALQERSATA